MWSRDGSRLFFETVEGRIMVVDCEAKGDAFVAGKPRLWTETQAVYGGGFRSVDLAADGKRLVIFSRPDTGRDEKQTVHLTFLLNFFDLVRRRLPSERQ